MSNLTEHYLRHNRIPQYEYAFVAYTALNPFDGIKGDCLMNVLHRLPTHVDVHINGEPVSEDNIAALLGE